MTTTAERLKQIMKERGLKQVDILELTKPYSEKYLIRINKSDLSQYVSGKTTPGQWKLTILGLALNVSEGWLMGLDVPKERATSIMPARESDGHEDDYVQLFNRLSPEQKILVIDLIKGLLSGR